MVQLTIAWIQSGTLPCVGLLPRVLPVSVRLGHLHLMEVVKCFYGGRYSTADLMLLSFIIFKLQCLSKAIVIHHFSN